MPGCCVTVVCVTQKRNASGLLPSPEAYAAILYNYGSLLHDGGKDMGVVRASIK